jgi:NAD-dependent deacetylase
MDTIAQALARCDLFVSIGTSGQVYPAAGFAAQAAQYGARTVEINLEQTAQFDDGYYGLASEEVPQYFERLLEGRQA